MPSAVSVLGYGRFGAALARLLLDAGHPVRAWDPVVAPPDGIAAPSAAVALRGARFVVLAVPIEEIGPLARQLRAGLGPGQIVVDVASVTVRPGLALRDALGSDLPFVVTHPLFGPASLARGERPLRVVICPSREHPAAEDAVRAWFVGLGCVTLTMDPHDHDRRMAETHALSFFLAKGLLDAGATFDSPVTPPSAQGIARTLASVRSDAGHLLGALHGENPYAAEARGRVLRALTALDGSLAEEEERRGRGAGGSGATGDGDSPTGGLGATGDGDSPTGGSGATGDGDSPAGALGALFIPDLGARSPELRAVRDLIDDVDSEIVGLLARRAVLARRARAAKVGMGAGLVDPNREAELRARRRAWASDQGLHPDHVDDIFAAVIRLSVALQERDGFEGG